MGDANKQKRYDRQIRIWGAEGQQRLEAARVTLLNCSPTGSETLKNLVLGGIASFTIIDGQKVTVQDLGNNFMVLPDSLGQPRAKVVTDLLQELNDSVKGSFVEDTPESVIEKNPAVLTNCDLLIATQLPEPVVLEVEKLCRSADVKLLIVRSYGLMGYMRASLGEHCIVDSKPDSQVDDLRITCPWPELEAHASSVNLASLSDGEHKHIPYGVLLLQALKHWREEHAGALPRTSADRAAFKQLLHSMRRRNQDQVPLDEENFEEALKAAFHAWTPPSIPSEVQLLLQDEATQLNPSSSNFWVIVAALAAFVANEGAGHLPLEGSIPDMHAATASYLALQRVYRRRADNDAAAVERHVGRLLQGLGRPADSISSNLVRHFCKQPRNLRVVRRSQLQAFPVAGSKPRAPVLLQMRDSEALYLLLALLRYRQLSQEVAANSSRASTLTAALGSEGELSAAASLYVLLRAVDRFQHTYGRLPGDNSSDVEEDVPLLKSLAQQLLQELGVSGAAVQDDYVVEMVRMGGSELHVLASVMGGMAAQESIKLITQQFVPFTGSLIYNAIGSAVTVFDL